MFHVHLKDVHIASPSQSSYDYRWILTIQLNLSSLFQHENNATLLNTAFNKKKPSNLLSTCIPPKVCTNSNQYAPLRNLSSFLVLSHLIPPMYLAHFHTKECLYIKGSRVSCSSQERVHNRGFIQKRDWQKSFRN